MKILQIISHYVPAYRFGGPLRVAHSLGKALVRQGHEVVVCAINLKNEKEDLSAPLDEPIDVDSVKVFYEKTRLSRYWGFSPSLYRRVKEEIQDADVALVHAHYQFANWTGAYLARKHEKPYVIFAHGSFNRWGVARRSRLKKKLYLRLFERRNIEGSISIAFNSEEEKQFSFFSEKGVIIPSGIDPSEFHELPASDSWRGSHNLNDKIVYLYLGRLNPQQKGLDKLLPAFARFARNQKRVHLLLAGPDERGGEAELEEMVRHLNIDGKVTFTGLVEGDEKLSILRNSDVFVLVSPSEGTSIALLEALYIGLPVMVSNRVGLNETIKRLNAGIVVNPSEEDILQGLITLSNDQMREAMRGKASSLIKEEYSWDAIAKTLIDLVKPFVA